ncbi:MAG: exosortase system-associated protein, TIGR04073 family [Candidatus Omnitrophica bacterium]|jgi:putative exosortase-associated protein (TIGR04073 family)|nr:exosortase system-associated protein, TIGR04073 family [Candidatus Omnitrophota bacterium]
MKKVIFVLLAALCITVNIYADDVKEVLPSPAPEPAVVKPVTTSIDTDDVSIQKTPLNKLVRGSVNSATFLLEIPASIWDVTAKTNFLKGYTVGFFDGLLTSVMRLGTGVFDIVTFIIPPYNKPLLEPEYAFDSAIKKMSRGW